MKVGDHDTQLYFYLKTTATKKTLKFLAKSFPYFSDYSPAKLSSLQLYQSAVNTCLCALHLLFFIIIIIILIYSSCPTSFWRIKTWPQGRPGVETSLSHWHLTILKMAFLRWLSFITIPMSPLDSASLIVIVSQDLLHFLRKMTPESSCLLNHAQSIAKC